MKPHIKKLALITIVFLFSSLSLAADSSRSCLNALYETSSYTALEDRSIPLSDLGVRLAQFDLYPYFDYRPFNNILFLSDGGKASPVDVNKQTHQTVVISDVRLAPGVNRIVDNNHLPFSDNVFDLIILNRGLCFCHSATHSCGGISTCDTDIESFLRKIIQVLDKNNENSMALLTGFYFRSEVAGFIPRRWMSAVEKLRLEFPSVKIALLQKSYAHPESFAGIVITTNPNQTPSERLLRLMFGPPQASNSSEVLKKNKAS